ncbi:MAG: Lrp/AsnC family transcriptional regulator [Chloroflexi bacterium]|nr:Lrp/AsnC family transcriptional regulator [Chloroflexota bacterium]
MTLTHRNGLDNGDRILLNHIQKGFPVTSRPFQEVGGWLNMTEEEVLERLRRLSQEGYLSRFGPVLNPRRLGGNSTLAAMMVPQERLEVAIAAVNGHPQVSHNYLREHPFNLWFVVSAESEAVIQGVLAEIEEETGLAVINLPMEEEYFVEVNFQFEVDNP